MADDFEDDPAGFLGCQVIEMAERLSAVDKFAPGGVATYAFEMNGSTYRLQLSIVAVSE